MKKQLLIALIFVLSISIAAAQTGTVKLYGKILTADGQPAWGLILSIKNTKNVAYTDREGIFRISAPAGNSILLIKSGVASQEQEVTINAASDKELETITIKEKSYELNEVVVTGQYEAQSLKNAVQKVRVISNDKIKLKGSNNLLDVLVTELGVRFSNDLTLGETDVQIMGMTGQNVKVLLDGIPLVDKGGTKQSLSQIDINTVERIEIVEGPMSVIYGTDALAGVVNVITKKTLGQDIFSITARVQEETVGKEYNAFSNDGTHVKNITVNYGKKGWDFGLSGTMNNTGGWQGSLVGRTKQWRPKDQTLANGRIGYKNGSFGVWYRLDYLDEDIMALGNINQTTNTTTDAHYYTKRFTHQLQSDWRISNALTLNTALSYQNYERQTLTTNLDFNTGKETLDLNAGTQDISTFNTSFFRSTLVYKLSNNVLLQPGVDLKFDEGNGQRILGNPSINDYSAFLTSEINLYPKGFINQISIKPGLRYTNNSVYDAPPVIPSINTKFTIAKDFAFRLSYARGFRAPALRELYFTFIDASHDIVGNENLKAEYSNSYLGSLSWQSINNADFRLSSSLSAFYNDFRDRIGMASGVDPLNPGRFVYVNIGRYKTTGGTLENQLNWKNLQADLGFSLIGRYNTYSEENESLSTFMFTPEVNTNLIYKIEKIGLAANIAYKFSGVRPGYEESNGVVRETKVASFSWADVGLNKTINSYLSINAGVRNLFNVTSLNNTSLDVGGAHSSGGAVPMGSGRSYFLGLNMQWNKIKNK